MKKFTLFGIFLALFFISCEGPMGPPGFDGLDGLDAEIGKTYELANVNFAVGSNTVRYTFPENIIDGDAVLVYRLEAVDNGLDIWEPLPTATIFFDGGGFLQYRFNYTLGDVDIIIESDDLSLIDNEFMLNQVFRIIVLPSDLISGLDTSNMYNLMDQLSLDKNNFKTLDIRTIE
ncbi:hypothetical protein [Cellulophaga sp. Hel_I_12]|uniref:hypothetical protein n=1 Tax=Cellulophaga sp. Hel_I_12 TaxID=1249972 RepID=UPI000A924A15|nr:hypothetical protein [Cellulophaga sp. Hel_I_12]